MKRQIRFALFTALFLLMIVPCSGVFAEDANASPPATGSEPVTIQGTIEAVKEFLATKGIEYGLNILAALLIFFVGKWLARMLTDLIAKGLSKAKLEPTLVTFTKNLCYVGLLVFIAIAALARLGVQTASFIAVVGAAGLAVGLALQGSLANFASGVLLIIFKPFKAGDFVEVAGTKGLVKEVHIFNTILNTPDNVRVIIPNAQVTGQSVFNYTVNGTRRVDLVIGVSYEDDIKKAATVIETLLKQDERVLEEPAPVVAVSELADSSVNFVVRPWVNAADYWNVYFDLTGKIKLALEQNGLTIPFPQTDVHIKNHAV
ncbi:MAG: mechanosensitive ion channel [Sedimentisphaerales bacterium]|nr:mechanosensitive ion channel [Sedimentisphaerales bacterium]